MSKDWHEDMLELEKDVFEKIHYEIPTIPDMFHKKLRKRLIEEEVSETLQAIDDDDIVELADGIVDSIVVLIGTAITYGIDIRPIWDEVHKSNMAKKGGAVREDGKRLKPENWKAPDVRNELIKQGWIE